VKRAALNLFCLLRDPRSLPGKEISHRAPREGAQPAGFSRSASRRLAAEIRLVFWPQRIAPNPRLTMERLRSGEHTRPACSGRRPRRPHLGIFFTSYWMSGRSRRGADCHTRVCSPELKTRTLRLGNQLAPDAEA
jgi:hypothetical protein